MRNQTFNRLYHVYIKHRVTLGDFLEAKNREEGEKDADICTTLRCSFPSNTIVRHPFSEEEIELENLLKEVESKTRNNTAYYHQSTIIPKHNKFYIFNRTLIVKVNPSQCCEVAQKILEKRNEQQ